MCLPPPALSGSGSKGTSQPLGAPDASRDNDFKLLVNTYPDPDTRMPPERKLTALANSATVG